MIHTCPSRLWYVQDYLYPSLLQQGIKHKEILIHNDAAGDGNLMSTLKSFLEVAQSGSTWHIQDDVVLSPDFNYSRKYFDDTNKSGVICGFCSQYDDSSYGAVRVSKMWYSFPCIRIPNYYARGFIKWINEQKNNEDYRILIENNKFDDSLFKSYMMKKHSKDYVFNANPNMVDHIDYLIGGSVVSSRKEIVKSKYFYYPEVISKLQQQLKNRC